MIMKIETADCLAENNSVTRLLQKMKLFSITALPIYNRNYFFFFLFVVVINFLVTNKLLMKTEINEVCNWNFDW